jgi:hypothetical protein
MGRFMMNIFEMGSGGMIHVPSLIKIGYSIKKFGEGGIRMQTYKYADNKIILQA